jgi:hypothetical protein
MATVYVTVGAAMGAGAPVYATAPALAEKITSSGSSQTVTGIRGTSGNYCSVTSIGGPVSIAIGQSPTAVSGKGYVIADGQTKDFGPLAENDLVAVIDA